MNFTALLVLLCIVSVAWTQDADYPEEVKRTGLLARRGPLAKKQTAKTTPTTTPAPPKDLPDEYEDGEEELAEEIVEEEQPTSTESSKKLKSGVVRPFRSNDDLLAALKRRRAEAANGKSNHQDSSASAPAESQQDHSASASKSQAGRRRFNAAPKSEPAPEEVTPAPAKASRGRFGGRGLYKSASNDHSEIAGLESNQRSVEVKPKSSYRPGQRRF